MRTYFLPLVTLILICAAFLRIHGLHQYPPGPHYDEAANILITRSIAFDGANLFPIANSYQGRESLYYYLNAPLFHLIGDDYFTLKLSSVYLNLLTIAASISLGRVMFGGQRGYVIGLAAGVMMTFSFHQILMSRQAFRAVTLPAMQALGLLLLFYGVRTGRTVGFVFGGVFSAGALYTYMASRLFPVWLGLGGLSLLWFDRANWRKRLKQGCIFFGMMTFTALPMIVYALQHPDIFFQRLTEVSEGEVTVSLMESIRRHIEMFFIHGDFGNLRYNDPGRPYFTLVEGGLLVLGWFFALWLVRQRRSPVERLAYVFVLLSPFMVIPSVISVAGFPPSHMRSLGMVPLIFILVAIGFEWLVSRLNWRYITILMTMALLIGSGFVWRDYSNWVKRADLFYQADGDLAAAARWLKDHPADIVYISSFHRAHPTVLALYGDDVIWLGLDSLFVPPADRDALVIFSHDYPPPQDWMRFLQPVTDAPAGDVFGAYRFVDYSVDAPDEAVRNPYLAFIDLTSEPIPAGETGEIMMTWQITQSPPFYGLRPILNLKNADDVIIASADLYLLGTDQWQIGDLMIQRVRLPIPIGTLPGDYRLEVTWADRHTQTVIPYLDGGVTAEIGQITILPSVRQFDARSLPAEIFQPRRLTDMIELVGWNPPQNTARPGEAIHPVLFVSTERGVTLSIEVLLGSDVILSRELQAQDNLLTIDLPVGIPRDFPVGTYPLQLTINGVDVSLGQVIVEGVARLFEPPPIQTPLNANFDDLIELVGYTLTWQDQTLMIDLLWQALAPIDQNYTVFVHLVNADGIIVAQQDAMPQSYTYPTSLWLEGEYVLDSYRLTAVLDDTYQIHIGLYLQETGDRLMVINEDDQDIADFVKINLMNINS
ncbi:MAG: hypothetical protein Kow00117_06060 [Phototrophicales bacterium]